MKMLLFGLIIGLILIGVIIVCSLAIKRWLERREPDYEALARAEAATVTPPAPPVTLSTIVPAAVPAPPARNVAMVDVPTPHRPPAERPTAPPVVRQLKRPVPEAPPRQQVPPNKETSPDEKFAEQLMRLAQLTASKEILVKGQIEHIVTEELKDNKRPPEETDEDTPAILAAIAAVDAAFSTRKDWTGSEAHQRFHQYRKHLSTNGLKRHLDFIVDANARTTGKAPPVGGTLAP